MFLEVALPLPLLHTFTYRCPPDLFHQVQPGQRVLVPFRNQKVAGYVVKKVEQPPRTCLRAPSSRKSWTSSTLRA